MLIDTGCARIGSCAQLNAEVFSTWETARNPIAKVEAYALILGVIYHWDSLKNRDMIWFVDNSTALYSAVKGSSGDTDVETMIQVFYLLSWVGNFRVYWEFVESAANWADGASRLLLEDRWHVQHGFQIEQVAPISIPRLHALDTISSVTARLNNSGVIHDLTCFVESASRALRSRGC